VNIKGRKLIFKNPEKADVLIFDEVNSQYVLKIINKKYRVGIFKTRPESIYLGLKVFLNFLRLLYGLHFKEAWHSESGKAIGYLRQFKLLYFESCFVTINPKVIVTLIDNCPDFHWFSKHCRKYPFIAIQNGSRLSFVSNQTEGFYLQHYFCFGEHERNLFQNIGYEVEKFYPVGSIIASLHINESKKNSPKYDILVVSTWRGNIGFTQDVIDTMRSMRIMDELLAKYLRERSYKAAIITRAAKNGEHWFIPEIGLDEESYYQSIYGKEAEIIETDFTVRNIYPLMQQSSFIISCLSSALLEGFGLGKKALYCNFTGTDIYHKDFDSALVTTEIDYESFAKNLDKLFDMPKKEYDNIYLKHQKYYMNYPKDKHTFQAISDKIDLIIEGSKLYAE
jgi:surface carbohydrate biosynthesis protein